MPHPISSPDHAAALPGGLESLLADPRLRAGSALAASRAPAFFALAPGQCHEFFLATDLPTGSQKNGPWFAPLTLLVSLARQAVPLPVGHQNAGGGTYSGPADEGSTYHKRWSSPDRALAGKCAAWGLFSPEAQGVQAFACRAQDRLKPELRAPQSVLRAHCPRLVCIGKICWPVFQLVSALFPLEKCLFLDPASDAERFWAIGQALRCPALSAIIADGSNMTATVSRRLQLAAESQGQGAGSPLALLARPLWEKEEPSWAATRWLVRPKRSSSNTLQWELECCRRQHAGQDAPRRWTVDCSYQVLRGTTAFHFFAGVGDRTVQTPAAQREPLCAKTA